MKKINLFFILIVISFLIGCVNNTEQNNIKSNEVKIYNNSIKAENIILNQKKNTPIGNNNKDLAKSLLELNKTNNTINGDNIKNLDGDFKDPAAYLK